MSLSLIRQADYKPTKDKLIRLKQSLDDGIFASTGKSGMELERLKNSLYDADVKYSQMKRIEDDSLYEGIQKGTTKELTQAKLDKKFRNTNDKLNEYLSGLDAPSRERLEIEAIKNTLERNIKETMGGKRVVDYSGMLKTLKDNPNYKSEAAKKAIEITEKMNKIHGLDHTLADAFKAPKDPKLQQGLSHNVAVRYLTMAANRAVQNTVKFLPFLQMGKTAASRHAIYNAVMSSSSVQELGEKLSKAAMNKDIPISEKIDIIEMAKAQFKFSNELDKAKADGIVKETAEQGSKLEQAEAKQGNKTVVRGNNIQIIENLDEAEIRDIVTNKKRVAVDMLDKETADKMGFKYPDVKRTIYADEITHTLKQHGNEAKEAARGQKAITAKDIANYHKFAKDADKNIIVDGERGQKVLISGKQINGHYVVVEEAQTKNNNLAFKTMYFRKGNVNDNKVFQSAPMAKDSQGLAFSPYKDDAQRVAQTNDSIIPQNPADRLVEKIIELDDAGEIGNMLQKTIISKDISTKTKLAAINAAKRRLVAITAKNAQKDDKKQK